MMTMGEGHLLVPCDTSPNTVSLHVLPALACCASCRLFFVTYAMIARQGGAAGA